MLITTLRREWLTNPPRELLAGAVATFALIPEVIAFSFAAGVDPQVGLYGSFVIGIVIAFAGGRPAMVSAAAGSVALVAAPLVASHGLSYLFAAGLLAGVLQIAFGLMRLGVLMRFVSQSVRTGFVNALAILIFAAQIPHLLGEGWHAYMLFAVALGLIYGVPRLTTAVPSPLIAIVLLTVTASLLQLPVKTVADLGRLPEALPVFGWPTAPFNWETLRIIVGPAVAIAMVGLLESLMTATVVDDLTMTPSSRDRECTGLGLANMASSLFGGIAGCGMIGQTVSNVKYGGRGRLSTLFSCAFLLVLMVALKPWVSQVPVVVLVAIMVMVSVDTFNWSSVRAVVAHPRLSSTVMLATVAVTVASHNLALGVLVGVLLSGVFFTVKVAQLMHVAPDGDAAVGPLTYRVTGQVFFASADAFSEAFDIDAAGEAGVRVDVSQAHFWDVTAVAALDKIVGRYRANGIPVEVVGMNQATATIVERLAVTTRNDHSSQNTDTAR